MTDAAPALERLESPGGREAGPSRRTLAWLLALACFPYVLGLAHPPLWDANEPLYAQPPKEALETGDWLAPTWSGRPWFVHPPLSSWLTMPSYALLGVNAFAERLPMAIAAILTILATAALGRAIAGRGGAILAAFVLAATPRYWLFARQLSGDVYLVACLTGAFALTLPALRSGGVEGRRRLLAAYGLVGVGMLAKGPAIVALFLVPLLLAARFARPRVPWRSLRPVAFATIVLALGAPWFVYMTARYGREYFDTYFGYHTFRRIASDDFGDRRPWYYLLAILGDAQPWILLLPFAIVRARRRRDASPAGLLAWFAAATPLVLFTFSQGKRNVYLLPCYPALAASLTPVLLEAWDGLHERFARAGAALFGVAAAGAAALLVIGARNVPPEIADGSRVYLGICIAACGAAFVAWRIGRTRLVAALTIGTVWVMLVASALLLPILGRFMPVPRLAATLVSRAGPNDRVIVYAIGIQSLMFYADRRTEVAKNPAGLLEQMGDASHAWVLASEDGVRELASLPGFDLVEHDRAPYFKFQFRWNIRGTGRSTRDLVLLDVWRADAGGRK